MTNPPITHPPSALAMAPPTLFLPRDRLPFAVHVLLAAWAITFLALGEVNPSVHDGLLQEDRFVEWLTVALFGVAGFFALRRALRHRRVFDGLVGAFCVFVAGEEFSWGQRLFGITPPEAFLEHNRRQELTVHNFASVFGEPKWLLVLALIGFGVLLVLAARSAPGRRVLERVGATAPPLQLAAWFVFAAVMLIWYPHTFTGEWVETLAGAAFLLTFMPRPRVGFGALGGAVVVAILMAFVSGRLGRPSEAQLACARAEIAALVQDLSQGGGANRRLTDAQSVHQPVFTAIEEGYVDGTRLAAFHAVACPEVDDTDERRRHGLDPWASAYWLDVERTDQGVAATVISFGPNRRRDAAEGDDLGERVEIARRAE